MKIYCLIDPITNDVMYIGKSGCLHHRYRAHVSLAVNSRYKGVKGDWIRYLAFFGLKPILSVLAEVPDSMSASYEHFYFKLFSGYPLVNTGVILKETLQYELQL